MSLLHAEYLKLSRRKLYPVMVLILLVLVGFTAFFLLLFGQIAPDIADEVPVLEKPEAYAVGAQQIAAQTWFPLILAVVILGGELGSTVWATGLTRDPSLGKQVGARLFMFTAAGWLAFVLCTILWAAVVLFSAPGVGGLAIGEWLGLAWRLALISMVWSALGLAAVAMLRSVGPAIGAALALSFGEAILALWGPYENVSLTAATTGLFGVFFEGFVGAFIPGAGLSLTHALSIIGGWTLLGLLLTWWGLRRRDA